MDYERLFRRKEHYLTIPQIPSKKLFVNNTTGAITCGNAGASVSGATETDWTVVSLANNAAAATGSVVIASNVK